MPLLERFLGGLYADMRRMESVLAPSQLNRVALRPPRPVARTGHVSSHAAKKAGVGHVVKFSDPNAAVDSAFRFTWMHGEIERHLERSGLAWTHLRPSQFMRVYFREVQTIVNEDAFSLPMGHERLAPVDVADIAKVARLLLREGGHNDQSYDMTGPEALTMPEIAQRISDAVGRSIRYVDIDRNERHRMLVDAGMEPHFADALDELFSERRKGAESTVRFHTHGRFGVRPTPFAEFAARNAAVFRGRSGA